MQTETTPAENEEKQEYQEFEAMILDKIQELSEPFDEDNEERIRQAVTLEYRDRGNYFGVFNFDKRRRMEWVGQLGKGLVSYPVIPRAIRAKSATSLATEIRLSVEANRRLPEIEASRTIGESIYERIERELWTEDFEININKLRQTQRRVYYELTWNPEKGIKYDRMQRSEQTEEIPIHGIIYACGNCGETVDESMLMDGQATQPPAPSQPPPAEALPIETTADASGTYEPMPDPMQLAPMALPPCPFCGAPALQKSKDAASETINPLRSVSRRTGDFDIKIVSALLTRIDDYSAIGGEFERARWFNVNELFPCYEIQARFKKLGKELGSSNFEKWSPGTIWHYALSKENGNHVSSAAISSGYKNGLKQFYEVQKWFFTPEQCHGWQSPSDMVFDFDSEDDRHFSFMTGETIEEAMARNLEEWGAKDEEFNCLCVWVANGKVLKVSNEDFRETYGMIGWSLNPSSYFPQGEERLLHLQDAATNVFSMIYSGGLKQQLAPLVANSHYFDDSNVKTNQTGGIIYVKRDNAQDTEKINWQNQIFYLNPPPLNEYVWRLAEVIIQIQKEESGIFDESIGGEAPGNNTARGKELMVNQGLKLMLSPSKTKKRGKIKLVQKATRLWQKRAPDAAYQMIPGTYNEEWKSSDIKAFKNCELESDLRYEVVQGTDIPKAIVDTQTQLLTVFQLGLLAPENNVPPGFVIKLLRALGVKEDYKNTEATRRLAQKRLKLLKEKIANINPLDAFIVVEEPNPMDPEGAPLQYEALNPQLLMSIMSDIRLQAHETENHPEAMEFYADQINGEMGRDVPDKVLINMLDEFCKMHLQTLNGVMSKAAASSGLIEGTGEATKAATVNNLTGAGEAEAAAMENEKTAKEEDRRYQSDENEKKRQFDREQKDADRNLTREQNREKLLVGTKREFAKT
jgi:hypothetical protein